MADKPSYLGMLNAISLAESAAHEYLTAWAEVTPDPEVRKVLTIVATREAEHGFAFAKRIHELGFEVRHKEDPKHAERMAIVRSNRSDLDKLEAVGVLDLCTAEGEPDLFDNFFRDHSIDIETGGLLGRYIAEERDTLRLLTACKATLKAREPERAHATDARLETLEEKVDSVFRVVEEVRQLVTRVLQTGIDAFFSRAGNGAERERARSD
jgi:rubrerythrin